MKELLTLPVFALFFLGVATQLVTVAQSSADKALHFTEQMDAAMDCAIRGVNLSICAPDLLNTDFTPELNKTNKILQNITMELLQVNITLESN